MITSNNTATAEIIQFPINNSYNITKNCEEQLQRITEMRINTIDSALSFLIPPLFESFMAIGFSIEDERKALLVIETIRAMMYNHHGLYHELDDFMDAHDEEITLILENSKEVLDEGFEELEE